jgi:signal transduction histidine kinase
MAGRSQTFLALAWSCMVLKINNEKRAFSQNPVTTKHILQGYLRFILYLIILAALIALFFKSAGPNPFLPNLIMSLSIGISGGALVFLFIWLFNPEADKTLIWVLMLTVSNVYGTIAGWYLGPFVLVHFFSIPVPYYHNLPFQNIVFSLGLGGIVSYFFYSKGLLKHVRQAAEKERLNRLTSEKEALEANLRLLQAQIEPHFLFNTLSNILSLIDTESSKGKSMLMDLIHYLRTSLSRTLPEMTTLGQEMDALKAYLNIQKIRLGDRLVYTIKVDEALGRNPFPPMLLQPLVENSIKHGLEPKVEGGEITITAANENGKMRISVSDTGLGFSSFNKTGVGVANVKERIRLLYGEKGRFILEENNPVGVRAIIEVPRDEL